MGLLAVSLAISIATGTAGSMGTLSMILPALIWCAISYSLPTTCLLTLLAGVVEVLMVDQKAGGISLVGHVPLIISARLGIASIAISPVIVAVSVQAINTLVRQLSHQVRYDYLTRVYSRFGLYERLKELQRWRARYAAERTGS
nr:membrane-bound diguanylate cyclase [Raoultella sp. NCTC 9187]